MGSFLTWLEWKELREGDVRRPDHSLERWISAAQELGDDINVLVGHGEKESERLDKEKKDAKAKPPEKPEEPEEGEEPKEGDKDTWDRLKQIHKDRQPVSSTKPGPSSKKSGGKSASGRSSQSSSSSSSSD